MPFTKRPSIWRAKVAFITHGATVQVGDTVPDGHPLLRGREHLFEPFTTTFALPPQRTAVVPPVGRTAVSLPPTETRARKPGPEADA